MFSFKKVKETFIYFEAYQKYKKKLSDLDTKYHGTEDNQTGPLVRRLQSFGDLEILVVGPWGEGGRGLHTLVKKLGDHKVKSLARSRGVPPSDRQLGIEISQIRRTLSATFVRAQSVCLLSRLSYLGKLGMAAGQRRMDMHRREEERRRERDGHYLAHIRGRGLSRTGQVFT